MNRQTLRARLGVAILLVSSIAACFDMSGLKDLAAVSTDINKHYQQPASINLSGSSMTVTFQNSPFGDLPIPERDSLAKEVARFAYSHYARHDSLSTISVGFQTTKGAAGFTMTRSETPYSWPAAELR